LSQFPNFSPRALTPPLLAHSRLPAALSRLLERAQSNFSPTYEIGVPRPFFSLWLWIHFPRQEPTEGDHCSRYKVGHCRPFTFSGLADSGRWCTPCALHPNSTRIGFHMCILMWRCHTIVTPTRRRVTTGWFPASSWRLARRDAMPAPYESCFSFLQATSPILASLISTCAVGHPRHIEYDLHLTS
jgi:hypothetical protein